MKIFVISPNQATLQEVRQILEGDHLQRRVYLFESVERAAEHFGQECPDLVILNGHQLGAEQLTALERFGHRHAGMAFIVLSSNATAEFLIGAIRIGVKDVLPMPIVPESLRAAVALIEAKQTKPDALHPAGKVITFISGKGGSGTTFLACNLAYTLAASHQKKVALLDLNLQFGDAALFVSDQVPQNTLSDVASNISRLDASLLASSMVQILPNFSVLAAPEDAEHALVVKPEHIEALLKLAKTQYDFVILDIGRTLAATSIKALDYTDQIFLVMHETLPFIRDTKRLVYALLSLGYLKQKIRLIINRYEKGGDIQQSDVEATLGMPVFALIPNSYAAVSASVNQGVPIVRIAKHDAVTKALQTIADQLAATPKVKKAGWFAQLFQHAQPLTFDKNL